MEATGIGLSDVELIVRAVSAAQYGHNIEIKTSTDKSSRRCGFTLRARDSAGPGSRGSAGPNSSGTGPNGLRRSAAACWHAHYDELDVLFDRFPEARVRTRLASYAANTFHERAMATAELNVGSAVQPRGPLECCECDHDKFLERVEVVPTTGPAPFEVLGVIYMELEPDTEVEPNNRDPLAGSYRIPAEAFTEPGAQTCQAHDGTAWRAGDPVYVPGEVPLWTPTGR